MIDQSFISVFWLTDWMCQRRGDWHDVIVFTFRGGKKKEVITAVGGNLFCWSRTSSLKRGLFNWLTCRKKIGAQLSGGRSLPHLSSLVTALSPPAHKLWVQPERVSPWKRRRVFFPVRVTVVSLSGRLKLCHIDKAKLLFPSSAVSCIFVPPRVDTVGRSTFHRATNRR